MALPQSPLIYVLAGAFISYILYTRISLYVRRRRFIAENGCQPCPARFNKDPFFGFDVMRDNIYLAKNKTFLSGARQRFIDLGANTFTSRMTDVPMIATCEPENIKTMLSLKFKDYSLGAGRQRAFGRFLGNGIFNSDGETWANSRHLLRPNFAREQVADLAALESHFKLMLKHIPKDGSTVDLQNLFFKLTIDTATEFLFNHSTDSLRMMEEDPNNEDIIFSNAFNFVQKDLMMSFRFGPLDFLRNKKEGIEGIRICHEYVEKFVDDAITWRKSQDAEKEAGTKDDGRYIFIHELAKQTDNRIRIRDELMNVLLAGRDTTASLLSNMFFEIAKRPEVWNKLKAEVSALEGRLPTYEELRNMKYLKWCMNESLRTHPVVPGNTRLAVRDTVLPLGGGPNGKAPLFVAAGTLVGYSPYTMHRRPDFYGPDADKFKPERWETLRPGWEYLPFNGGPRICLGQQYALTEAGYTTVRLVQEFARMESRDTNGGVWVEGLALTCASANGTRVGLFTE